MNRLLLVAAVALALPAAAFAKGPSSGTLSGPGLDSTVQLGAHGHDSELLELTGFWTAFAQPGVDMLVRRPAGMLGPRYTLTWELGDRPLVQHVYPWAAPKPLVYTPSADGWFVSTPELREVLGIPAEPSGDTRRPVWPWLAAALSVALAGWFARARWISAIRTPSASSASTSSTPTTG